MVKALLSVVAGLSLMSLIAFLVGGLLSLLWNYFPFLESLYHMNWISGTMLYLLSSLMFRSNTAKS